VSFGTMEIGFFLSEVKGKFVKITRKGKTQVYYNKVIKRKQQKKVSL